MEDGDSGEGTSYKREILERLEENSRKIPFWRMKCRKQGQENRNSSVSESINGADADEVLRLKQEIGEIYKLKSKNDQNLIDANRKVTDCEAQILSVTTEKQNLRKELDKSYVKIAGMEVELAKLKTDNATVNDERLALAVSCNALTEKKKQLEDEHMQLLNRIRDLNEQRAENMNAEIALQEQRRQLRIQEEIAKAVNDTSRDARANSALKSMPAGLGELNDVMYGDHLPTFKMLKFQADEGEVSEIHWLTGETFATGGSDRHISLWRLGHGEAQSRIGTLAGCNASVTRIDFDFEKRSLLASCNDKNVRLWNIDTRRLLVTLSGHTDKVSSARFLQSGNAISGSFDRTIKLWDLGNQRCSRTFLAGSTVLDITRNCILGNALFLSGHMDKKVRAWDGRSAECIRSLEFSKRITSLDLSTDGHYMLSSTRDDTLSLIDLRTFGIVHDYSAEQYQSSSDMARCVISPGGEYIAAGSSCGHVFIWNTDTTRLEKVLRGGNENPVLSLSWNPTGVGLLSADKIKSVVYWK
ncbi:unnamed protein product [Caenorhabditis auriculariae]|uniref:Autophagy-related protein 16 domain-containing protein n=1 Tax=Caenorhabditis auriculariae TaxID=2777116 RepID=A0A8S1H4B3_9PELO|nr:unnamed protein product [Caenorhabditis auriculariae]